jgi:hypothetical protein
MGCIVQHLLIFFCMYLLLPACYLPIVSIVSSPTGCCLRQADFLVRGAEWWGEECIRIYIRIRIRACKRKYAWHVLILLTVSSKKLARETTKRNNMKKWQDHRRGISKRSVWSWRLLIRT